MNTASGKPTHGRFTEIKVHYCVIKSSLDFVNKFSLGHEPTLNQMKFIDATPLGKACPYLVRHSVNNIY